MNLYYQSNRWKKQQKSASVEMEQICVAHSLSLSPAEWKNLDSYF